MNKNGKPTYAGKIKNSGSMKVEALFPTEKVKGTVVQKGEDLRIRKGGNK